MLEARLLHKSYISKTGLFGRRRDASVLNGVTLAVGPGETVGLVGESGSGKSTLARCLAMLEPADSGEIRFEGVRAGGSGGKALDKAAAQMQRRGVQLIFQDPYEALNPKLTVEQSLTEPLVHFRLGHPRERRDKAAFYLEKVGLGAQYLSRFPDELSRGQCQRINIARALMPEPRYLICDEILSALDVTSGARIVQLLDDLRKEWGFGCLFISHDLARVAQISARIAVMHNGEIVECLTGTDFWEKASHPRSRALLESVPPLTLGQ